MQAAVVLADDPAVLPVSRDGKNAWVHSAAPGTVIDLEDVLLGHAFQVGGVWQYDRTLWDF